MRKVAIVFLIISLACFLGCAPPANDVPEEPAQQEEPAEIEPKEQEEVELQNDEDLGPEPAEDPSGELKVHFLDVGQGDSILVQIPGGVNLLIDGGPRTAGEKVVSYLKQAGVSSIDLMIGTHPHEDHIGGLISVLEEFPVVEIIDPAVVHTTQTFEDYLTIIDEKDVKFTEGRAGMERDLGGGAQLSLLHPEAPSEAHLNNASVVAKLEFGQVSFLFTGDAEEEAEQEMLSRSENLASTTLKVAHHGSSSSSISSFIQAVDPDIAVIQCGVDNRYGHPHDEVLQRLAEAGIDIYLNDLHGDILITTDGQGYEVSIDQPYQHEPEAAEPEPAENGQFVGSSQSDRYHYQDCRHAENISPDNIIWFDGIQDAKNQGYVPCGGCRPPE